ncbi:MAG: hypothetical protein KJN84_02415, partial [Bacteroidia bacterium]|nr:hypothetical protein [Bacteroidia bacterium]
LRTEVERLLADDETRQGIRARINLRPINYIFMGISYSKRFQSSNQNKSDNINGYISHSKLPGLNGRLSLNFNMNTSLFLESKIIAIRYSRSIIKKVLDGDFYFRIVNYNYLNSEINLKQNYIGGNLSFRISKKMSLNILGEHTKYRDQNKYRMNVKILKRF